MIEKTEMTLEETVESLTGYDELAVVGRFGDEPQNMLDTSPVKATRALAFIVVLRGLRTDDVKAPDAKAYQAVMGMTLKQIGAFFADDEDDEPFPDEPLSAVGKDEPLPV